ncbi:MAG: HEAT repeat domain-containing protein [Planctomycetota bacterium]|nr:HEAT repeat domain-containing protein [Planctomycetota bacterium]
MLFSCCHPNQWIPIAFALAFSLNLPASAKATETPAVPQQLAGKTLDEWVKHLTEGDLRTRLVAVRTLPGFAARADDALLQACQDKHAAVRFWAITALGDRATGSLTTFQNLLKDPSLPVRTAAAYARCRLEIEPQAFDLLQTALQHPSRGLPIFAADWLGKIGSPLAAAALSSGTKHKDYHIRNACLEALQTIKQAKPKP